MSKRYKNFVVAITIIPIIAIVFCMICSIINVRTYNKDNNVQYKLLKETCCQIASGEVSSEQAREEGFEVLRMSQNSEDNIFVIEIQKDNYKVAEIYPFEGENIIINNGKIYKSYLLDFENVIYVQNIMQTSRFAIAILGVISSLLWILLSLILFVGIPQEYKKCNQNKDK